MTVNLVLQTFIYCAKKQMKSLKGRISDYNWIQSTYPGSEIKSWLTIAHHCHHQHLQMLLKNLHLFFLLWPYCLHFLLPYCYNYVGYPERHFSPCLINTECLCYRGMKVASVSQLHFSLCQRFCVCSRYYFLSI